VALKLWVVENRPSPLLWPLAYTTAYTRRRHGKQKCGLRYVKTAIFCTCGSNNWETVEDRWVHAARCLTSIELSFHPCNILRHNRRGVPRGNKNVGCGTWKLRFLALAVRITGKLLKIDGYMLRGVWQAFNCLSSMQLLLLPVACYMPLLFFQSLPLFCTCRCLTSYLW